MVNDSWYDRDWERLEKLFSGDEDTLNSVTQVRGSDGDVYCFFGDESLHTVGKVEGERERVGIVIAYARDAEFVHYGDIHPQHGWRTKKEDL